MELGRSVEHATELASSCTFVNSTHIAPAILVYRALVYYLHVPGVIAETKGHSSVCFTDLHAEQAMLQCGHLASGNCVRWCLEIEALFSSPLCR